MKLLWTVVAVAITWSASLFTFMMVAFAGGGYANSSAVNESVIKIFDLALLILPACWAVAGILMLVAYFKAWGTTHYWWVMPPLALTALFGVWVFLLLPRS